KVGRGGGVGEGGLWVGGGAGGGGQGIESGGTASSNCGQRLKSASSAHFVSMRASWWPRQKWMPVPNDKWRLGLLARSSFSERGVASGSMFAAANMTMILSPFFSRNPPSSMSFLTKRGLVN